MEEKKIGKCDPTGREVSAPGAKLDFGKTPAGMLETFPLALLAISLCFRFGADKGYCRGGWRTVPGGHLRYLDASWRHKLLSGIEPFDHESGLPHEFHSLWSSMASLELLLEPLS